MNSCARKFMLYTPKKQVDISPCTWK